MNILVCMSVVPDTTTKVRFDPSGSHFDPSGVQWIINPWDEFSLTRALELKENPATGVEKVSVVTVGSPDTEPVIRKALAVGADDAFRIDLNPLDGLQTATELANFIEKNPYDLILCGIESSDYNGGMVGGMLAEKLGLPSLSSVSGIEFRDSAWIFRREIDGGYQHIKGKFPLVAIVQKGIALVPRIPAMRGIMQARTKPLTNIAPTGNPAASQFGTFTLPPAKAACTMIPADEIGKLVNLLHQEARVI